MMRRKIEQSWRGACAGIFAGLLFSAVVARSHGDFHIVIGAANEDITKDPTNPEPYLRRAELFRIHEQYTNAAADIASAEILAPTLPGLDIVKARLFLDTGWPLSARAHLDRFLKIVTNSVDGYTLRSRAWAQLGQPLYAAEDFARAIAVTPEGAPDLYIERAHSLAAAGAENLDAAIITLDQGIKRMGPLVTLQLTAIDLEVRRKNYDGALARVDTVLQRSPRKESWLSRKGEILLQAGRPAEAKKAYSEALTALNTLPPARRNVPAVADLERRIRLELELLDSTAPKP